jgi:hypothetical protein
MPNEKQELETEEQEFETHPSGNKDLWLFLIVLDVVFLCVFGFFIYRYFATHVFAPRDVAPVQLAQKQETVAEETVVEEPAEVRVEKAAVSVAVEPKEEPVIISTPETIVADVLKTEPLPEEPVKTEPVKSEPEITEKKESISITGKGKYRQVTFRWFGEGNKVAVVSGFTMAKPQALNKVGDHWEKTLVIAPGAYKFLFMVDGKKTLDPYSPEQDGRSVLEIK